MTFQIKHSLNTIGCRVGDDIYVHPQLHKEPELYKAIIKHESEHTKSYALKDFLLDLFNRGLKGHKKAYYAFMLKHPRTLLGLLPITKIGKYWAVDFTLMILYIALGLFGIYAGRSMV